MDNASFSPWGNLYLHARGDLYRELRDAFDSYYLAQVAEWRQRAGLGLYSASSSPDKLQPVLDSQQVDAVVGPSSGKSSKVPSVVAIPPTKMSTVSVSQSRGSSSVAEKVREKNQRLGSVPSCSSSKEASGVSRKRSSQN